MNKLTKDLKLLIFAQASSMIGGAILNFALALFVLELTGAVGLFSTILAAAAIPTALLTPIGGVFADRLPKKALIVWLDVFKGVLAAGLALVVILGWAPLPWIGVVMLLVSTSTTLYAPVIMASVPQLADQDNLVSANGIIQGITALSDFTGPVLAAFIMRALPMDRLLIVAAAFFLGSALIEAWIKIPYVKPERNGGICRTVLSDLKEGFVFLAHTKPKLFRLTLILAVYGGVFTSLFLIGIPYFTTMVFGLYELQVGFAQGAIAFSMLLGGIFSGSIKKWLSYETFPVFLVLTTLPLLLLAFAATLSGWAGYLIFTFAFMVMFFFVTCINVFMLSTVQGETPEHLVGKVMGMGIAILGSLTPIILHFNGYLFSVFADSFPLLFILIFGSFCAVALLAKKLLS